MRIRADARECGVRIFKTKWFARWANKEQLDDTALTAAVEEMRQGLTDADLGGRVYKKRIARPDRGKSGGLRTLIAFQMENRAVFVYGFAKNARGNVNAKELKALKHLASKLLDYESKQLRRAISAGELQEVNTDEC